MSRSVLTENGWEIPSINSYTRNGMTSAGRVAPVGTIGHVRVVKVVGGQSPSVHITHGRVPGGEIVASVSAVAGNEIDLLEAPIYCPNGIYLEVSGNPQAIECDVRWK